MISVLYVDDEPALLEITKLFLEKTGQFSVDTVTSATEALERLKSVPCEIVVSDYQMPDIDGIEFLKILRNEYPDLPFIIFTGKGREEIAIAAFENGADFYVQKGGAPKSQFAELVHKINKSVNQRNAERALRENERRFRQIIQNSSDIIRILDSDGKIIYDSPSTTRILGYPEGFFIGKSPFDFIHPDDQDLATAAFNKVRERKNSGVPTEFRIRAANGDYIEVESVAVNLVDVKGIEGIVITTRPITERKRAEQELRKSEEKYRMLVENATDGIVVIHDGIIRFCNQRMIDLWGGPVDAIIGRQFLEFAVPEEVEKLTETYKNRLAGIPGTGAYETVLSRRDGSRCFVEINGCLIDYEGKPADMVIIRDITERKRMVEKLKRDEEKFRNIFETSTNLIMSVTPTGKIVACNRRIHDILGYEKEEIIGQSISRIFLPEDLPRAHEICQNIQATGVSYNNIIHMVKKDGSLIDVSINSSALSDPSGPYFRTVCTIEDISRRLQDEQELRAAYEQMTAQEEELRSQLEELVAGKRALVASEHQYRSIVEHSPLGMHFLNLLPDDRLVIIGTNQAADKIFEIPGDQILGKTLEEAFPTLASTKNPREVRKVATTGIPFQVEYGITTGTGIHKMLSVTVFRTRPGSVTAMILDITGQKKAEMALMDSEKHYRVIAETMKDVVWILDPDTMQYRYMSPSIERMRGYSSDKVMSQTVEQAFAVEDREHLKALVRDRLHEFLIHKDETVFYTDDIRQMRKDGSFVWTEIISNIYINDETGRAEFRGVTRDISDRKVTEARLDVSKDEFRELFDASASGIAIYEVQGDGTSGKDYIITDFNRTALQIEGHTKEEVIGKSLKDLRPNIDEYGLIPIFKSVWKTGTPAYYPSHEYIDGKFSNWYDNRVFRLRDQKIVAMYNDVTEQKRSLQQLEQINKKIDLLTSITHHDMSNKLHALCGYLDLMKVKTQDPTLVPMITKMEALGAAMVEQIEFSREYRNVGLRNPKWQNISSLIDNLAPERLTISHETEGLAVYADPLIEKVFANLQDNTIRHGGHATAISVTAHEHAGELTLVWEDNGVGVSLAKKEKIFERGFGKNTGFGLFLIREILAITGIAITETGTPGSGARFEIVVPKGAYRFNR